MIKCKRKDCDNAVPDVAIRYEDPYCSTVCARKDHGVVDAKTLAQEAKERREKDAG